jgi:tryptophan-rich hypothetical protein
LRRAQLRFLLGSRWTARAPLPGSEGERHFEVIEVRRSAAAVDAPGEPQAGPQVVLRAVLTSRRYLLAAHALEDVTRWAAGWQSLPPAAS